MYDITMTGCTSCFSSGESIILYHGSDKVIETPSADFKNPNNDYGSGLYCTQSLERAKEWAAYRGNGIGYVNQYSFNETGLKILDLTSKDFSVLHWITMLVNHRVLSEDDMQIFGDAVDFLSERYFIDVTKYDVAIGYRADDSYFSYARAFLSNQLPLQRLAKALELGALGRQYVLLSTESFDHRHLQFSGAKCISDPIYLKRYITNDKRARDAYQALRHIDRNEHTRMTYIIDLMRKEANSNVSFI